MPDYLPQMEYFIQTSNQDGCLGSVFEIENVMIYLKQIENDMDHLKGLKKHRIQSIDSQIQLLEDDTIKLRNMILQTMKKLSPNQKTLNFPDIGKVSRRVLKDGWEIADNQALIDFFDKEGKKNEVIKITESLDMRNAKKLVEVYEESGVNVPGVKKIVSPESISISFEEKKIITKSVSQPSVEKVESKTSLDELEL